MKNSAHLMDESGDNMSVRFAFPLIMIYCVVMNADGMKP
jgi:hypothetical protein